MAFNKFYWAFLLIMFDFRLMGFDILPDIIGYIFIVQGVSMLIEHNDFFMKAKTMGFFMILLSIISIYSPNNQGDGFTPSLYGNISIIVGIAALIIDLILMYNLFMGIKDLAMQYNETEISNESDNKWKQYRFLVIAGLFSYLLVFFPPILLIYLVVMLIAMIVIMVRIMKFMKRSGEVLQNI